MKTKISVNQQTCISCGTCWALDDEHFIEGDHGKAMIIEEKTDSAPAAEKLVKTCGECQTAKDSCPVNAITIKEVN